LTCEILDIGQCEPHQFIPLLEAESRAWRENLCWDFTASAKLICNCLEEQRLAGYALVIENQIRGYCFFFCEGDKGLIGDLFAEPTATKIGQVRKLLEYTIAKLASTPGLRRIEAQLPHFSVEQLEPCFRARCFEAYRRRFMAVRLADPTPEPHPGRRRALESFLGAHPAPADFSLELWQRKYDREAAQLLYCAYGHHVDTVVNDQYGSIVGTTRLIENIVHHGGCGEYLPRASLVAIHRSTQKLAGLLALTAIGHQSAHIPQLAVAGQFQRTGLATAMLHSGFKELARQGYRKVSLTVTDLNAGAVRLYERLGFETFRPFGAFVWTRPQKPPGAPTSVWPSEGP
jgi:ribosomal protein S18 acetylase RimI-like enzyme